MSNLGKKSDKGEISDLGIEELKRIYDFELSRNNSLESKASSILGFVTLVVTILIFVLNFFLNSTDKIPGFIFFAIVNTLGIIIIISSLYYIINTLRIRVYITPFDSNPNELKNYLKNL